MAWTRAAGWVWVVAWVDHSPAEAWAHAARSATASPPSSRSPTPSSTAGRLEADVARGLAPRHDWGPQYRSAHFPGSLAWLGISDDPAFLGEPETNGCAEPWIRTLTEQCLWVQLHDTVEELGQAVAGFVDRSNSSWLSQRHSHQTPKEPISQLNRQQRHDQVGTTSVQETGRCSVLHLVIPRDADVATTCFVQITRARSPTAMATRRLAGTSTAGS
jgi:transposase InsO family protein